MSDIVLVGKLALAIAQCAVAALVLRMRWAERLSTPGFARVATLGLGLSRLSVYVAILIVMGVAAQSDVLTYYGLAHSALAGQMPYRDFFNGYGPLFPLAAGLPVALWDSPKSIILFSILVEIASLPLWIAVARKVFPEATVRTATVLYVFNPFATISVALGGQNNVWLSLALAASFYFVLVRKDGFSGWVLAVGVVVAKFLSLLHAPILLALANRRWLWVVGFALPPLLVYGYLFASGVSIAGQLAYHGSHHSSGNLPYLLTLFGIDISARLPNRIYNIFGVLSLLGLLAVVLAPRRRLSAEQGIYCSLLLLLTLMLVSRKSFTGYLLITLFPLCLLIGATALQKRLLPYFVFCVVAALESSLWYRWIKGNALDILWLRDPPVGVAAWSVVAFLIVQVTLVGFYSYYAVAAFRGLRLATESEHPRVARGIA